MNELFGQRNHTPLYVEVRDTVLGRISTGAWKPGEMLPSESAIGQELGVSQGTVRKALDDLAAQNLVVRRQGKGTFVVAEHIRLNVPCFTSFILLRMTVRGHCLR